MQAHSEGRRGVRRGTACTAWALLVLAHCAASSGPGDARADAGVPDVGASDGGPPDVVLPVCAPDASRCHFVVHACDPAVQNECAPVAQCEAGGYDAGFTAYGVCTAGPQVCAQADHCDDDAALPDPATCHCGLGPACPAGAVCVSEPTGAPPACRCIHGT